MAKCGPKPKQISARQLRNLIREEKKALAAQRSARQPPLAPPSPRLKKRIYTRPSQHDVSLARKKQVKVKPRTTMVRKARTESSVAFSAVTEEIPLFNIVKRASNLVYMPQAPVPLVFPITPPTGIPAITDIGIPPRTLNVSPGLDLGSRTELLATPRVAATSQPRPFSSFNLEELKFQVCSKPSFSPTFGYDLACTSPDLQRTPTRDNPASFVSPSGYEIFEDLGQVQVLSQLSMEPESHPDASPKVVLPKKPLLVDRCSERMIKQAHSPQTSYHRFLMASTWAQPAGLSLVRNQLDLRDVLHVHHRNSDILSNTAQESVKPAEPSIQPNGLVGDTQPMTSCPATIASQPDSLTTDISKQDRPDTKRNTQPTGSEATLKLDDTGVAHNSVLNRGGFDGYGARRSLGTNHTPGAFANAVLRQTGHLRKVPESIAGKPPSNNALRIEKDRKAEDMFGSLRGQEKSKLFNSLRFQSTRNESLQSRAPTSVPYRSSLDGPKLPSLAPAAIIINDPFRRPSERPNRKRVISVGRVIDFTATTPCEVQDTRAGAPGIPDAEQTNRKTEQSVAGANMAAHRRRSKRHWTKRVIADDICHHVSMEGGNMHVASPRVEVEMPLNVFPTPETGSTFKQRITTTLRAMYHKLWA